MSNNITHNNSLQLSSINFLTVNVLSTAIWPTTETPQHRSQIAHKMKIKNKSTEIIHLEHIWYNTKNNIKCKLTLCLLKKKIMIINLLVDFQACITQKCDFTPRSLQYIFLHYVSRSKSHYDTHSHQQISSPYTLTSTNPITIHTHINKSHHDTHSHQQIPSRYTLTSTNPITIHTHINKSHHDTHSHQQTIFTIIIHPLLSSFALFSPFCSPTHILPYIQNVPLKTGPFP
jgi:hypothetical protein